MEYIFENFLCTFMNKFCKVKKNKIIFVNMMNFQYACNLKYIAEELLQRKDLDLDLVWITNKSTNKELIPPNFRLVKYNSLRALYEFATAKVWIANAHMFLIFKKGLVKNKDTLFFQTYHGSMGIKKIDNDAKGVFQDLGWLKWQKKCCQYMDYLFTDSQMEYDIFKSALWGCGQIEKIGKARDSIFYKDNSQIIEKIKNYYNIPKENKILLYAPTWRADGRTYCFNLDIKLLKRALSQSFGGGALWSILIRTHVHIDKAVFNSLYNPDEVINVSAYPDMQELLSASDVLISDYSSCIPEYTILKKPSFIYAVDLDLYKNSQGFYYPLSVLPSPIAQDNGELANNILNFDKELFTQKAEEFLKKMGHSDDENSCERIVNFILEKMNKNDK